MVYAAVPNPSPSSPKPCAENSLPTQVPRVTSTVLVLWKILILHLFIFYLLSFIHGVFVRPNLVNFGSKVLKFFEMSSSGHSRLLFVSSHFQLSSSPLLRTHSLALQRFKGWSQHTNMHRCNLDSKENVVVPSARTSISCSISMSAGAGQSGDPGKINLESIVNRARKFWDSSPEPVKIFPWSKSLENFVQLILDLILTVIKYLCVPLLAVSSLSEMSYCAHERKLFLIPIPLLIGMAVAGVLRDTALELSPLLKDAEVPWHLIAIATVFTLLKLPGPYYPYWGRILIPHLANGGLLRALWFAVLWYGRPKKTPETTVQENSGNVSHSVLNKP